MIGALYVTVYCYDSVLSPQKTGATVSKLWLFELNKTMDNANDNYLASGDYLSAVRDFALMRGISVEKLIEGSELTYDELIDPPDLMPNLIVNRVGLNLYRELEAPISDAVDFGLCMTASSHGSLGLAVQSAPTLGEAYEILVAFYHTRINSQTLHVNNSEGFIRVDITNQYKDENVGEGVKRFFDLATLITIAANTYYAIDKDGLDGQINLFIDAAEPDDFPYEKLDGIGVNFVSDCRYFEFPSGWSVQPLSIANPSMAKVALARCEQELKRLNPLDLVSKIRSRLADSQDGLPSLSEVADYVHMSSATLKRKLKERSITYQDIKDQVRLSRAIELIEANKESLESIAEKLGFSDASNFTKAFKKWTGKTPRNYREGKDKP